jgi:hypothetical protein
MFKMNSTLIFLMTVTVLSVLITNIGILLYSPNYTKAVKVDLCFVQILLLLLIVIIIFYRSIVVTSNKDTEIVINSK